MCVSDGDVGITEFLGSHRPFRGIVKQTVDDFVVNEISLSGKIARITQLARSAGPRQTREPTENTEDIEPPDLEAVPFDKLDALFQAPASASTLIRDALNAKQTSVTLPACTDKQTRTQIHAWVRQNLPGYVTDTVDDDGRQAVRLRRKDACRPWKRRRVEAKSAATRTDAAKDETYDPREGKEKTNRSLRVGPNTYVQFTLWKRNKDTTEALSILGKILHVPANAFTYAGTKDKRAVTTQLVQVRGISEGKFAHANRVLQRRDRGLRSMAIGNVEPAPRGTSRRFGLGDLHGNRFTIALRDLEVGEDGSVENVMAGVDCLRKRGFVNYFGLQRFGSGVSPTHETGFAALRGDFEEVCRRILLPLRVEDEKEGMRPDRQRFVSAMERFAKREITARELQEDLPRWMHIERTVVRSFVDDEDRGLSKYDFKKAFGALPRNLKKMYGHAVQSYLWNIMASERVRQSGPDSSERMFAVEGDIVPSGNKLIRDFSYQTEVRAVTKEEEESQVVSVYRVLIPVLGSEVCLPDAEYACTAGRILEEQKIDLKSKLCAEFGMKGTYRALITKPLDVEAKVVRYADRRVKLIQSGVDPLNECTGPGTKEGYDTRPADEEMKAGIAVDKAPSPGKHGDSSSNGDAKNEDSFEETTTDARDSAAFYVAQNEDRSCQLDSEVKHGRAERKPQSADETPSLDTTQAAQRRASADTHALILSFTLGCAEYATMMIRELTRQDSSTANQKALQDGVPAPSSMPDQDKKT